MKYISEELRRYNNARLLGSIVAVRGEQRAEPTAPGLSDVCVKVLVKAALEPGIWQEPMCESLSLHPAEEKAAVDDLLARAMVKQHHLPKGRGGQPVVLEVLPKGLEELAKRGITPTEKKLKRGGFLHDCYARYLEKWAHGMGYRWWFERVLDKKAFDFVYEDERGVLRAIEICLSGSAEWTAKQILKGAEVEGVAQVMVACERKPFVMAVMKEIQKIDALGLYRGKIVGKLLAEYLECVADAYKRCVCGAGRQGRG